MTFALWIMKTAGHYSITTLLYTMSSLSYLLLYDVCVITLLYTLACCVANMLHDNSEANTSSYTHCPLYIYVCIKVRTKVQTWLYNPSDTLYVTKCWSLLYRSHAHWTTSVTMAVHMWTASIFYTKRAKATLHTAGELRIVQMSEQVPNGKTWWW